MKAITISCLVLLLACFQGSNNCSAQSYASRAGKGLHQCKPGPWGNVEYFYSYLEAPESLMELVNTPSEITVWDFPDKNGQSIRTLFKEAGISETTIGRLFERKNGPPILSENRLYPSSSAIVEISPESRTIIYRELRRHAINKSYRTPVIIASGDVDSWFANSGMSPETISLIKKLTYKIGDALAFSDTPVLLAGLRNDREERRIIKALTRTRTLIARLKMTQGTDMKSLKDYWSAGYKKKDIMTFFEAYAGSTEIQEIDIAHLLPPRARKYLYTFPSPDLGISGTYPDSFVTTLQFFENLPDDPEKTFTEHLNESFDQVQTPHRFGDILVIEDSTSGKPVHASVFIADDIVYTKLGRSLLTPFVLMKYKDVLAYFGSDSPRNVKAWRRSH